MSNNRDKSRTIREIQFNEYPGKTAVRHIFWEAGSGLIKCCQVGRASGDISPPLSILSARPAWGPLVFAISPSKNEQLLNTCFNLRQLERWHPGLSSLSIALRAPSVRKHKFS